MKLAGVGRNNALYIKSTIKKRLENGRVAKPDPEILKRIARRKQTNGTWIK